MLMEEEIYFKTSDGLKLCGILSLPKIKTQKCIVLCHGIGDANKEEDGIFTELAYKLCNAGFAVFRFDFRGQGESEGEQINMTVTGEEKDLNAAINFLRNKGFRKFGIVAASFGGGAASLFVGNNPSVIKGLVLWNAGIDYSSKINATTAWGKKYWGKPAFERADKFGFTEIGSSKYMAGKKLMDEIRTLKPFEKLIDLDLPMLFIHGNKDSYIPYSDSVKYSKLFKNARLVTIDGAEHGFHDDPKHADQADKAAIEFFLKYL